MYKKYEKILCPECIYCNTTESLKLECRKNTPTINKHSTVGSDKEAIWPTVCALDWCGEAKPTKPTYSESYTK